MTFHAKRILPHIPHHSNTKYYGTRLRVLDVESIELARQLTLFDSYLFNQIKSVECMHEAWRRTESWMAVNIKEVLKVFQQVGHFHPEAISEVPLLFLETNGFFLDQILGGLYNIEREGYNQTHPYSRTFH
ncbi:hypothetical protein K493DRAFT_20798 [Basidiobolus meristosporus CBS 931.73]|uniref:Ras-GEF domain-containing protein n=1 Tax=Basidiobolus meristosporus CBS 931.73 TaxID=1314790 RepID=A0A1Y1Z850_9FUNG|nr:hypothetical protein K493DRAFT_20798 [Basidiobolus meristosporus CBS 931.73]|eukprot:ORY06431.1 hypothetical protein K493DRAFT_20798 [Basidiobolus meristosporus CBS 931.73]